MSHIFPKYCIDLETLLSKPNLDHMLRTAFKQSKTEKAKKVIDLVNFDKYQPDESCPLYFGFFFEWFAQQFLNKYGLNWDIDQVEMVNEEGKAQDDRGVDGWAVNSREHHTHKYIRARYGSPIAIQVKATLDHTKEYTANDGSRINNFVANALTTLLIRAQAYEARLILITSGKGLHYTLKNMTNDRIEVINYNQIRKFVDNDYGFLNYLRTSVGLKKLTTPTSLDQDALTNESLHRP